MVWIISVNSKVICIQYILIPFNFFIKWGGFYAVFLFLSLNVKVLWYYCQLMHSKKYVERGFTCCKCHMFSQSFSTLIFTPHTKGKFHSPFTISRERYGLLERNSFAWRFRNSISGATNGFIQKTCFHYFKIGKIKTIGSR